MSFQNELKMRGIRKTKKVGHGTSIQECGDRQPAIYLHPSIPLAFQISIHCVDGINRHYISNQDSNFPDQASLKDKLINIVRSFNPKMLLAPSFRVIATKRGR